MIIWFCCLFSVCCELTWAVLLFWLDRDLRLEVIPIFSPFSREWTTSSRKVIWIIDGSTFWGSSTWTHKIHFRMNELRRLSNPKNLDLKKGMPVVIRDSNMEKMSHDNLSTKLQSKWKPQNGRELHYNFAIMVTQRPVWHTNLEVFITMGKFWMQLSKLIFHQSNSFPKPSKIFSVFCLSCWFKAYWGEPFAYVSLKCDNRFGITWSFITTMFRLKRSWCVMMPVNHWVAESCLYTRTR